MNFENLPRNQKIRAALHRDVRSLCSETCHFLGLEITKSAMEIISELVYKKIGMYGLDLEAFAKHAKRATVNSEDVKLLVRRNPSLKSHLNAVMPSQGSATKDKRRKTVLPIQAAKQQESVPSAAKKPATVPSAAKEQESVLPVIGQTEETPGNSKYEEDNALQETKSKLDDGDEIMAVDQTIDLTFD